MQTHTSGSLLLHHAETAFQSALVTSHIRPPLQTMCNQLRKDWRLNHRKIARWATLLFCCVHMTHFLLKVEQLRWRKRVEEFNLESEWRQSHGKHGPSKVTYTFKTNSASDHSVHPYSNQWRSNTEKTAVPWNHASTYCNTNADKKGNTPSPCQSSHFCCTWWKQLPSVRRREEKIQLKLNVTRSPCSSCRLTRNPRVLWLYDEQKGFKLESPVLNLIFVWCCSGC